MTDKPRFAALRMNRRWVVYDDQTKENLADYETEAGANAETERLNLAAWREAKPVTAISEPLSWESGADLEESLLRILDKCWNVEFRAAA